MARRDWGSLTKEPPISTLDGTLSAIRPGMSYDQLLEYARKFTHRDAPGLIRKRFILVDDDNTIVYDRLLQLVTEHEIVSPFIRKIMYFVWAYRDERLRRFICEKIANRDGKWRSNRVLNKGNASFFTEWVGADSAKKARSNIEFYLIGTGIFKKKTKSVHLDLNDGWLTEAAIVAAQYERNALDKRRLLTDPREFLIRKNWTGLVNASPEELRNIDLPETDDPSPLEDATISVAPVKLRRSDTRSWDRQIPKHSAKQSATAFVDLVTRERASKAHYGLEKILAETARLLRYEPKYNEHIDIYFDTPNGTVLAEIKSANSGNYHSQIRKGVSQLFEYRFVYKDLIGMSPTFLLIVEVPPPRGKFWLIEYLETLGITLAWKDPQSSIFISNRSVPPALIGIVHSRKG